MKKPASPKSGYAKISATLEAPVLRQIREHTANVSRFLNEAAKRKLYFDRLRAADEELGRMGIEVDERFYRGLKAWARDADKRRALRRSPRRTRRAQ